MDAGGRHGSRVAARRAPGGRGAERKLTGTRGVTQQESLAEAVRRLGYQVPQCGTVDAGGRHGRLIATRRKPGGRGADAVRQRGYQVRSVGRGGLGWPNEG